MIINKNEHSYTTLSPKIDVVFQALFGEVGSEAITSRFLSSILNEEITSIDLSKNPVLKRDFLNDKLRNSRYCNLYQQLRLL